MSLSVVFCIVALSSAASTPTPRPSSLVEAADGACLAPRQPRPAAEVIDNARLVQLAAAGRVEQAAEEGSSVAPADEDEIWQALAKEAAERSELRLQWRARLETAVSDRGRAREAVTVAEAEVGAVWIAYLREKKPERRDLVLAPRLEVAKGRLAAARQRLERARLEVEATRREARRAGIPPGWLRDLVD